MSRSVRRVGWVGECDLNGCTNRVAWKCSSCVGRYCAFHLDDDICPACQAFEDDNVLGELVARG